MPVPSRFCPAFALLVAALISPDSWGDGKQITSSLVVTVQNAFDRGLTGAAAVMTGSGSPITVTQNTGGVYTFTSLEPGDYTLDVTDDFFIAHSGTVSITNLTQSVTVVLVLDEAQFPHETLDAFRSFDADMNGEISEDEFTATFAGGADAHRTLRDECACALTPRELAVLARRPFLSVSSVKAVGDGAFPTGVLDFGAFESDSSGIEILRIANEGGGRLEGAIEGESHGVADFDFEPDTYTLPPGTNANITVTATPRTDGGDGLATGTFTGIFRLSGNYDAAPLAIALEGEILPAGGEGEGEGEGEPAPACEFLEGGGSRSLAGTGTLLGAVVILLGWPRRKGRRKSGE